MRADLVLALELGIGIVAGLRSSTAPAAVSWAAALGWLDLHGSALAFMGSRVAVVIFSADALASDDTLAEVIQHVPAGQGLVLVLAYPPGS